MQKVGDKEIDRLAVYYHTYRQGGKRAIEAYMDARKLMGETDSMRDGSSIATNLIQSILPIAVAAGVLIMAFKSFAGYIEGGLWITSQSGKTTVQLPFKLAMRVIRRRGWRLAKVEPVKPRRVISRREAFKILMSGDNGTSKFRSIPRKV